MSTLRHTAWSSSGLIQSIQRNTLLPASQATYTQADMLALLNEALQSEVIPYILSLAENYFVTTVQIPIIQSSSTAYVQASAGSAGPNVAYQLPPDAIGKKLVNVSVVTAQGIMLTLPQVTPWQIGSQVSYTTGCFTQGDLLYLFPAAAYSSLVTIQLTYPQAPLALCDDTGTPAAGEPSSAEVGNVAVDTFGKPTGVITVNGTLPSSFTVGAVVNFVSGQPQFRTTAAAAITNISGFQLTVDPVVLTDAQGRATVNVGDWVANVGYAPFLQLPVEARNLVTQAAIVKILEGLGDNKSATADGRYKAMKLAAASLLSPRIDDSPKTLTSSNRGIGASWSQRFRWGTY